MATDAREREREALQAAQCAIDDVYIHTYTASGAERAEIRDQLATAQDALEAYGRAVREADKEAGVNGLLKWAGERNRYVHPELVQAIEATIKALEEG